MTRALHLKEQELADREAILDIEKKNNPERKLEAIQRKEKLDSLKEKFDHVLGQREQDVQNELNHIERDWKVYEHLQNEKESIKQNARRVLNEQ